MSGRHCNWTIESRELFMTVGFRPLLLNVWEASISSTCPVSFLFIP